MARRSMMFAGAWDVRLEQMEGALVMPTIAYFCGIAIRMFFRSHPPPHSGHEANVSIETGDVIEGYLPANATRGR
jgi:hypothetical protein